MEMPLKFLYTNIQIHYTVSIQVCPQYVTKRLPLNGKQTAINQFNINIGPYRLFRRFLSHNLKSNISVFVVKLLVFFCQSFFFFGGRYFLCIRRWDFCLSKTSLSFSYYQAKPNLVDANSLILTSCPKTRFATDTCTKV